MKNKTANTSFGVQTWTDRWMALALDTSHTGALNLAALQGLDPSIISIRSSVAFAAVYRLTAGKWEKLETEGALFLAERCAIAPQACTSVHHISFVTSAALWG